MTEAKREAWGSWLQFLFSLIGSLVGLGNIWRFPYICHRNGGGAFLIPFVLFMVILGIPIGFLELMYYQYAGVGPGKVWVVCPLFKGIWFGMMVMVFVVSMYYTMLMAYILYYLGMSFSASLPWATCGNAWNSENCITQTDVLNKTSLIDGANTTYVSSSEEYWLNQVLKLTPGVDQLGGFCWELVLCLFISWLVSSLCVAKGVQAMGKVAYVAATLPYILLTILLVRGLMLPGSVDGIYYFFNPKWDRLVGYSVWRDAATQLFFSIGFGSGIMGTLASYNKFHNNCYRDALMLPILDTVTSVFAGVIIFAYMGYMAHISGVDVDSVVQEGPGLVFIAYPTALQTLPLPQLWAVLFFFMLFCTGLDSQFCHIQALCSAVVDFKTEWLPRKTTVMFVISIISFLLSLPMTTQGGIYILNLLDWYIASISIMFIVIVEHIIFAWIYGVDRLFDNIEHMIGHRVPKVFGFAWKYVTPLCITVLWTLGITDFRPIGAVYPGYYIWCDVIGLIVAFLPIIPIPIMAVTTLYKQTGSLKERVLESIKPTKRWRPSNIGVSSEEDEMEAMTLDCEKEQKNGHQAE